ncbi:hypothetical protein M8818_003721 [Zalaria obscura]|uniref:Uncharacterized protein n=1 Tax=Zalaria obscura TaxID=2024903 RepID=A0ACC3SEM1_9PEZI
MRIRSNCIFVYETHSTTLSNGVVSTYTETLLGQTTTLSNGHTTTVPYSTLPTSGTYSSSSPSSGSGTSNSASSGSAYSSNTGTTSNSASTTATSTGAGTGRASTGTATSPSSATTTAASHSSSSSSTPPASVLAGGIVGGFAGLAVLLLVAMFLIRYYRRRSAQMHQLTESESQATHPPPTSRAPGMAERAGLLPLTTAAGAFFKTRFHPVSQAGPGEGEAAAAQERGFTRVSGRKLPSAFSPGMEQHHGVGAASAAGAAGVGTAAGTAAAAARDQRNDSDPSRSLSNHSFYRDSSGFYGGEGEGSPHDEYPTREMIQPGPARTPTVHPGGPWTLSPGTTPGRASPISPRVAGHGGGERADTPATMASLWTVEGSRGSRFTEEV